MSFSRIANTLAVGLLIGLGTLGGRGQTIHYVAQMNTEQIKALDHKHTAVLLPGGILEQHGPYLPSYSDGYINEYLTKQLADAIAAKPGWSVLVFPTIPLGVGGANEIGRKYAFPGSYNIRSATERDVFMDLGSELGEQGFRNIFIVHAHGAPDHNRTLDEAGDFFRDTYGGHMVHITGLMPVVTADDSGWTDGEKKEEGYSVHAGGGETSLIMFLRHDLVGDILKASPQRGGDMADLVNIARKPDWPGYFGSPRIATAVEGERQIKAVSRLVNEYAIKILDGLDERTLPRFGDVIRQSAPNAAIDRDAQAHELQVKQREQLWLKKHGLN